MAEKREEIRELCRRAFRDYEVKALWSLREPSDPTPRQALAIARALRHHGDLPARRLAERIEELCRGAA
jgi:hypothetical protein